MTGFLKEFRNAFLLGLNIFVVHALVVYLLGNPWYGQSPWEFFYQNQMFSVALYLVNTYVFKVYYGRYDENFWTVNKVLLGLFLGAMASIVTVFFLRLTLIVVPGYRTFSAFVENERISEYYLSLSISVVATAIYYAVFYWKSKQDKKVKRSRIIAGTASAKFDALKNQLDPHFLFNSLNVLTSLIEENPQQAQKFTTSLSKVYRYVLEQKSKELVPVDEELAFARTYMNLIKMRFEDSIEIIIPEKASNPEAKVVPLSLQLLLENAVKHNMVTPSKKLFITIAEKDGMLTVSNNLQPKQILKKSSGVGLQNIKQRYQLLTERNVEILESKTQFSVGIPMLTKQSPMEAVQETYIENKKYKLAKEQVEKMKGFYVHFAIYLLFVPIFIYLNVQSTSFPWALFPIGGWGLGVAGHASETFNWSPIFNKEWEKRKIQQYMEDKDF
ncbi:histidine kinase [Dokdonia sinensis]|uniref:Histidine kinase n=1 Tax=Dokdonia sinensis TaxID=2479847 RepID=A0A3M0G3S6_9FLAO|nr:histidine kinase [Dokdonia sinensis]RMB59485.1 histidine kinase [Dokdonia sinensis]